MGQRECQGDIRPKVRQSMHVWERQSRQRGQGKKYKHGHTHTASTGRDSRQEAVSETSLGQLIVCKSSNSMVYRLLFQISKQDVF